jgi:S-adenosyl methyltransferase
MCQIDTSVPHAARVYDYWLGGKDNYEVDRELGDAMVRAIPTATSAGITLVPRSRAEVEELFAGTEIAEPGVVPLNSRRPEVPPADPHAVYYYGGVGRKR